MILSSVVCVFLLAGVSGASANSLDSLFHDKLSNTTPPIINSIVVVCPGTDEGLKRDADFVASLLKFFRVTLGHDFVFSRLDNEDVGWRDIFLLAGCSNGAEIPVTVKEVPQEWTEIFVGEPFLRIQLAEHLFDGKERRLEYQRRGFEMSRDYSCCSEIGGEATPYALAPDDKDWFGIMCAMLIFGVGIVVKL